jgi:DNA-binding transcriptional LysR family regulator
LCGWSRGTTPKSLASLPKTALDDETIVFAAPYCSLFISSAALLRAGRASAKKRIILSFRSMKFRHLEYFVAAAEELNFTHAAARLNVSQPPFSKQIHDLEAELGIDLFERQQKGVALTAAGRAFLIDAKLILGASEAAVKKAQRISRGEIGELTVGYLPVFTHGFLGSALELWREAAPGIVVDYVEMDGGSQEKALLEGRIDVGLLLQGERPVLQLLRGRPLLEYPARVALPQVHHLAERSPVPFGLLRQEPLVGLNRLCPTYDEWLRTACRREGFVPRFVKEADGASSALAFVAAGFGLAVVSQPVEQVAVPGVVFRELASRTPVRMPIGAVWNPDGVSAGVASQFVDVLAQVCAASASVA